MDTDSSRKQKFEEEGDPGFFFTRKRNRTGKQKRRRSSIAPRKRPRLSAGAVSPTPALRKGKLPSTEDESSSSVYHAASATSQATEGVHENLSGLTSIGASSQSIGAIDVADREPLIAVVAEAARKELGEEHSEFVDSFIQQLRSLPEDCPDAEAFTLDEQISELEAQRKQLQEEIQQWTEQEKRAKQLVEDANQRFQQRQQESMVSKSWDDLVSELPADTQETLQQRLDYVQCASLLRERQQHLLSVRDLVKTHHSTLSRLMHTADGLITTEKEEIGASQEMRVPGNLFDTFRRMLDGTPTETPARRQPRRNISRSSPMRQTPSSLTDTTTRQST